MDWDGDGAGGASAIGSEEEAPPTASLVARGGRGGGGGARVACPLPTWWPLAKAAVDPAGGDRRRG